MAVFFNFRIQFMCPYKFVVKIGMKVSGYIGFSCDR